MADLRRPGEQRPAVSGVYPRCGMVSSMVLSMMVDGACSVVKSFWLRWLSILLIFLSISSILNLTESLDRFHCRDIDVPFEVKLLPLLGREVSDV